MNPYPLILSLFHLATGHCSNSSATAHLERTTSVPGKELFRAEADLSPKQASAIHTPELNVEGMKIGPNFADSFGLGFKLEIAI